MKTPTVQNQKDMKRIPLLFSIDTSKLTFAENGAPEEIQVLMAGKWNHPVYGPIIIEAEDLAEFKQHFDEGLRRDIPITEGHESFDEKPAVGWFKELTVKDNGLWATMEWTPKGKTLLAEKSYKYFSPEFYTEYEDPETREIYENVLVGGALTNKPYFKSMTAVVLSERSINKTYIFNEITMNIADIIAKKEKGEALSAEEVQYLKDHKDELSTEQLAVVGDVLETETPEEKEAREKAEGDANEAKGLNRDGSVKTPEAPAPKELTQEEKDANVAAGLNEDGSAKSPEVNASEKNVVKMTAAEHKALTDMANKGAKAFAELRTNAIKTEASKLIFSEQNSKGKVLPKDEAKLFSFMLGLTDGQRKAFAEIVDAIPSSKLFGEVGKAVAAEGSAAAELEARIQKSMSEDNKLTYSDALRKVIASDKDLAARYSAEQTPGAVK